MANIRSIDMKLLDDILEMHGDYVLDFNNRTFSDFFMEELSIKIDDPRFEVNGSSKAKRLRTFLKVVQDRTAARTLLALWEYRRAIRKRNGLVETVPDAEADFTRLIARLGAQMPSTAPKSHLDTQYLDLPRLQALAAEFVKVSEKTPQIRGYAFEEWLRSLCNAYDLDARASFRLSGEQIDGSFELSGEIYLLEARWRNTKAAIGDLHAFHGKLEQKAFWSRGLFISMAGFTDDGLAAFGKGKRLVCMDGLDLHEMLQRGLAFSEVLNRKVRRAAETGSPYASVRVLF